MKKKEKSTKKGKMSPVILILFFVAGLSLLLYPTVSDWWNSQRQSEVVNNYTDEVEELDSEQYEQILTAAEEYNRKLLEKGTTDYKLTDEELEEYYSQLNLDGTGIMGYIEISVIDVSLPIYHSTDEATLAVGAGHIPGSSLPVGGSGTHCVISGHRGLPSAKLFTDLDKLEIGDTFVIHTLNETFTYEVDQIRIVLPAEVSDLTIEEGKDYCTLVTCTPYGINTHRLLVRGHRIENESESVRVTSDATEIDSLYIAPFAAIPMVIALLVVLSIKRRRKKLLKSINRGQNKHGQEKQRQGKNRKRKRKRSNRKRSSAMKRKLLKILCALVVAAVIIICAVLCVYADGNADLTKTGSVSVTVTADGGGVSGASFSVYLAADAVNRNGGTVFEFTDEFKDFGGEISEVDSSGKLAELAEYALNNNISAQSAVTDEDGKVLFDDLKLGTYLVVQTEAAEGYGKCDPFLVSVPYYENGEWVYDAESSPKAEVKKLTDITIKKVWNDGLSSHESVSVSLLLNGETVRTVTLDSDNDWTVVLTNMPQSDFYSIEELNVPSGYKPVYSSDNTVFTVTNNSTLIQTGQLIWPIPVLALFGLVFIVIGTAAVKRSGKYA